VSEDGTLFWWGGVWKSQPGQRLGEHEDPPSSGSPWQPAVDLVFEHAREDVPVWVMGPRELDHGDDAVPLPATATPAQRAAAVVEASLHKLLLGVQVSHASLGAHHAVCCARDGRVFVWGYGCRYGQLGLGDGCQAVAGPSLLESLSSHHVVQVNASPMNTAVVTRTGRLYTWGLGTSGQLGQGKRVEGSFERNLWQPGRVGGLLEHAEVVQVSSGGDPGAKSYMTACVSGAGGAPLL